MDNETLGRTIRRLRRAARLRQDELAALAGVGNRFLSELENGKPTVELSKAIEVLQALGYVLEVRPRRWSDIETTGYE